MKKIIALLLLFALSSCLETPERDCKAFKTGKFKFEMVINGIKRSTTFVRTENQEIDFFEGKADTSSIRWINDCEYIIQNTNPKNREEKKAVQMKILTTDSDSYTFEYSFVGDSKKQRGTVTKLK